MWDTCSDLMLNIQHLYFDYTISNVYFIFFNYYYYNMWQITLFYTVRTAISRVHVNYFSYNILMLFVHILNNKANTSKTSCKLYRVTPLYRDLDAFLWQFF